MQRFVMGNVKAWMVGCVATLLLGGMVVSSLHAERGASVRARVEHFVREQEQRVAAVVPRVPFWGESYDEDAGLGYAMAAVMLRRTTYHSPVLGQLSKPEAVAQRSAAWPALAPIVEVLQRAAHAQKWLLPKSQPNMLSEHVLQVAQQCVWERGEHTRCVQLWLDEVVVALDRWAGRPLRLEAAWPPDRATQLEPEAARLLASGLVQIEERLPLTIDLMADLAAHARHALAPTTPQLVSWQGRLASWRHGFDAGQHELAAVDALVSLLRVQRLDGTQPVERMQQLWRFLRDSDELPYTDTRLVLDHYCHAERWILVDLAGCRMLRLALAFQLGGPLPDLVDPRTGKPFQVTIVDDIATFRSECAGRTLTRWAKRR